MDTEARQTFLVFHPQFPDNAGDRETTIEAQKPTVLPIIE
ncbi:hypothetical protein SAMN05421578_102167 [Paenibacillus macquariensis]|uniref:Uncharacterized protein n=1 Tax=Paenibacillus macquariensis TaxID=948756 RepID=A0ABY1JMW3_9BACL|nr:hypothetical protein SAMN05421578_102167 [Paenibacillus macquariensis]